MRVCLVSREVAPYVGGGLAVYVTGLARLLAGAGAEVTIVTRAANRVAHELLVGRGGDTPPVQWVWVEDPTPTLEGNFVGYHHAWSGLVLEALRETYGNDGPELLEFPDYHGEAFATLQGKRAGEPFLRNTSVLVRAHSSWEMCSRLNGHLAQTREAQAIVAIERWSLANANRALFAGGDIEATYRRMYDGAVAPGATIRHPLDLPEFAPDADIGYEAGWPLRFLYLGRAERRKGALRLLEALLRNPSDDWSLTYLGGDTDSGVLGTSVTGQLELMAPNDPRVTYHEPVPRTAVPELVRGHDVLVTPSLWECWPYAVLEAMALGRPVLATPTGGFVELVEHGVTGWLTAGTTVDDVSRGVDELIAEPAKVTEIVRSGAPARHAHALTAPEDIAGAYERLAEQRPGARRPPAPRATPSLVSVIVPYHRMHRFVADTVESIAAQTWPRLEVIVVDDGSLGPHDRLLDELDAGPHPLRVVTQPNGGLGAARNLGVAVSRGRYVFPLDADNMAEPEFVEKAVRVLEADPRIAYATAWSRFVGEDGEPLADGDGGYAPLGNEVALVELRNVAGDAAAVLPRSVFDLGYRYSEEVAICEDWMLYRALRRDGRFGIVLPERLIRYRIRLDSMYQDTGYDLIHRVQTEMTTQLELQEVGWTAPG
jgi:glycosyltransferase involved in cell wall biosynthesis